MAVLFSSDSDEDRSSSSTKTNFFLERKKRKEVNEKVKQDFHTNLSQEEYTDDEEYATKEDDEKILYIKAKLTRRRKVRLVLKLLAFLLFVILATIISLAVHFRNGVSDVEIGERKSSERRNNCLNACKKRLAERV